MKTNKKVVSYRMSEEGRWLLDAMARKWGIPKSAVLELLIRDRANAEGVTIYPKEKHHE
jgi:DNA-binding PadR family transcriptional regulator